MDTLAIVVRAWQWNVSGLCLCAVMLVIYVAAGGLRRSSALFITAEVLLGVLLCSPLEVLARRYLLTAEAIEQVLLGLVLPYVFVLGAPAVRRSPPFYVAWMGGMAVLLVWCLHAATTSEAARFLEYVALLVGGILFWWPLHSPVREQRIPLVPHALLYLTAGTIWCSFIGIFVAFGRFASNGYAGLPDTLHIADSLLSGWNFTQASDKETAGLLFWIGASTVLLTEVMFVYYRWYAADARRAVPYSAGRPLAKF